MEREKKNFVCVCACECESELNKLKVILPTSGSSLNGNPCFNCRVLTLWLRILLEKNSRYSSNRDPSLPCGPVRNRWRLSDKNGEKTKWGRERYTTKILKDHESGPECFPLLASTGLCNVWRPFRRTRVLLNVKRTVDRLSYSSWTEPKRKSISHPHLPPSTPTPYPVVTLGVLPSLDDFIYSRVDPSR